MQDEMKVRQFKIAVGEVIRELRETHSDLSLNKFAMAYDFDKGNFSKTERGLYSLYLITAWRISEALGIRFSDFAKKLEDKLGKDFVLMDE